MGIAQQDTQTKQVNEPHFLIMTCKIPAGTDFNVSLPVTSQCPLIACIHIRESVG